jgi:hypothetical protein
MVAPWTFEFHWTESELGVGIMEIGIDGEQIPESRFTHPSRSGGEAVRIGLTIRGITVWRPTKAAVYVE